MLCECVCKMLKFCLPAGKRKEFLVCFSSRSVIVIVIYEISLLTVVCDSRRTSVKIWNVKLNICAIVIYGI